MIKIPDFDPRPYQLNLLRALDNGKKRALIVWHRRAGKEIVCFNYMVRQAWWHRIGYYVYFFPTTRLGRRIIWDGMNKDGRRFISYIPKQIIEGTPNDQEMKIRLTNGSVIQVIGTDLIENVGVNPIGCVFSEFSLQDEKSWTYTRPILKENGGWAIFNGTPRGRNHFYDMYLMAKNNPDWFCEKLSVHDTGVLKQEDLNAEKREGMSDAMIAQEYLCEFDQGVEGAYYAKLLNEAETEGRVTNVPYDTGSLVDTYWDLGVSDETVILFVQNVGQEIHIIDIYRNHGEGLNHYVRILHEKTKQFKYIYGDHYAPHDIEVRELGSNALSRKQLAKDLGVNFKIAPKLPVNDGIELARGIFPRLWIDKEKCQYFLKCLENYQKHYNQTLKFFSDKPLHDWSSHCADAFRYMSCVLNKRKNLVRMSEEEADNMQKIYQFRI